MRSLTGGEELDANSLERKLRATVAAGEGLAGMMVISAESL